MKFSFDKNLALKLLSWALIVSLIFILALGKNAIQLDRQGDAAIFEQLLDNIYQGNGAVSNVFANTQNYIDNAYAGLTTEALLEKNLSLPEPQERNMLAFHAYYCMYVLAVLKLFFSSSFVLSLVQVVTYVGLLVGIFCFIKGEAKLARWAFLGVAFVFLNPNWFVGIMGQFYPDRLFIIGGFLLLYFLHKKIGLANLAILAITLSLINERAALISGLVIGAHQVFFYKSQDFRYSLFRVLIALLLLSYFYIQKNIVLANVYYAGYMPQSWDHVLVNWSTPGFSKGLWFNIANNSFLLVLACFSPRYALIALAMLLPNWLGNIGGAEKVGWLTHYHSYYFPVLAFAAAAGLVNIIRLPAQFNKRYNAKIVSLVFLCLLVSAAYISQKKYNFNGYLITPFSAMNTYKQSFKAYLSGAKTGLGLRVDAKLLFDQKDIVSTTELGMALLHDHVKFSFFPIGLNSANSVFVPCNYLDGGVDRNVQKILTDAGFKLIDISSNPIAASTTYCLLKR